MCARPLDRKCVYQMKNMFVLLCVCGGGGGGGGGVDVWAEGWYYVT